MESLPAPTQYSLLVRNIHKFDILVTIALFSLDSAEAEMSFLLSENDLTLFMGKAAGSSWLTSEQKINLLGFPTPVKQKLIRLTKSCAHPILKDRTVFVLLVLIVLFNDTDDQTVTMIRAQYWTMLRRILLQKKFCGQDELESCLAGFQCCLYMLIPQLVECWAEAYGSFGIKFP